MIYSLIRQLYSGASITDILPGIIFTAIVVLFSLSFHEMSHGWMAYKLGDPTARSLGRLTLDPRKHLDLIGTISMLLFGFGWAKPVPVNSRYFKKPKRDMALTALAGPVSNILLSFVACFIFSLIISNSEIAYFYYFSGFSSNIFSFEGVNYSHISVALFGQLFYYMHILNLYLAIFNLIPIPPLDGSRILFIFLPDRIYFGIMKYERYIMLAMLLLLYFGVVSNPLSNLCSVISNGMFKLFSLIPGVL